MRPNSPAPLRILYSFPHAIGAPGIGETAWNQVAGLARAGHIVTAVVAAVERPLPREVVLHTTLTKGIRIPHRAFGRRDRALTFHDLIAARVLRHGRFDLVHAWPLAAAHTFRLARELGVPTFREAPNTQTAYAYRVVADEIERLGGVLAADNPHRFNAARLHVERQEWSLATAVLVPSAVVEQTFLDAGFAATQLVRHRYGCDVRGIAPRPAVVEPRPLIAVFAGRCEPRKGLHHALDAWIASTASKRGRFLIYGTFVPGYAALLGERLRHPSVEVLGFDPHLLGHLRSADVLLLPSVEEGSALVTYEAQAAGCVPLVSTAAGALLEDGVQGFLHEAGDVAALTAQLDRLDREPGLLETMRQACVAHRPELSWSAATAALVAAYRTGLERAVTPKSAKRLSPRHAAVLICTRDRPAMLAGALAATIAHTPGATRVVVVDSGSESDRTRQTAEAAGVEYVRLDRPGLSIARNAAIAATDREVVLFTDDDCEPQPKWVENALAHFADPRVGAVSGTISTPDDSPTDRPTRYRRVRDGLDAGHGAVMAFRRRALAEVGGFDPVLGAGRRLAGAEDLDMFARLIGAGWIVLHDPAVRVAHVQDRVGGAYRTLLGGYGRGLGGMVGKFLCTDPSIGLAMSAVVARRFLVRAARHAVARGPIRADIAMLRGIVIGVATGLRTPIKDGVFVDRQPPEEVSVADREVAMDGRGVA